jgi:hypothetical protein
LLTRETLRSAVDRKLSAGIDRQTGSSSLGLPKERGAVMAETSQDSRPSDGKRGATLNARRYPRRDPGEVHTHCRSLAAALRAGPAWWRSVETAAVMQPSNRVGRCRLRYPGPLAGILLSLHPTVKPVALVADAILDCSRRGDLVNARCRVSRVRDQPKNFSQPRKRHAYPRKTSPPAVQRPGDIDTGYPTESIVVGGVRVGRQLPKR